MARNIMIKFRVTENEEEQIEELQQKLADTETAFNEVVQKYETEKKKTLELEKELSESLEKIERLTSELTELQKHQKKKLFKSH